MRSFSPFVAVWVRRSSQGWPRLDHLRFAAERFYVDDSEKSNIRVYDVADDGTLRNGRIFGEEPGGKGDVVPDGIKVEKNGNLFVTGPKGIRVWDAEGNHLGTIVMPEQPANLKWGDKDNRTLYITAATSVYRIEMKTQGFVPYL
jgi:gluconolactonase